MIDIEAIANRHLTSDKMDNKTFYEGHIVIDLHNAIEEIKELRAALVTMQGAYELGVDTERDAVVAWLREWQNTMDDRITHDDLDYAIAVIERGEHNKENK